LCRVRCELEPGLHLLPTIPWRQDCVQIYSAPFYNPVGAFIRVSSPVLPGRAHLVRLIMSLTSIPVIRFRSQDVRID
jgi:hypothetical protein